LIFDLDGTLIDSRADLVQSVNAMLSHLGRPTLPDEVVAAHVGDGAAMLVRRSLGADSTPEEEATGLEYFLAYYADHKLDRTTLYPDVAEGLDRLDQAGYRMAVLTNKPVRPSREIVDHLGVARHFFAVYGGNSFAQKKPDPCGIHAILAESGTAAGEAVMIGDSAIDIRCGRNAGTLTAGVTYGFMPQTLAAERPDRSCDSFAELTEWLLNRHVDGKLKVEDLTTHGI